MNYERGYPLKLAILRQDYGSTGIGFEIKSMMQLTMRIGG
jgi:hypothetical protein